MKLPQHLNFYINVFKTTTNKAKWYKMRKPPTKSKL